MANKPDTPELDGEKKESQEQRDIRRVRRVVADTYSFVRSQEFNRSLSAFTLDHFIEEAKRQIKGTGKAIRDATGSILDLRPTKLESLNTLEDDFQATLETAEIMAKAKDAFEGEESP